MSERTPEQLGKETGEALGFAIANGLEPILMRLADAIATLRVEQAELRDEVLSLADEVAILGGDLESHVQQPRHG
jgi:hypothetical protein